MKKVLILFLTIMLMIMCKSKTEYTYQDINGKWTLYKAIKNGRETKTLDSAYFQFTNNKVSSNLFDNQELTYSLKNNRIEISHTQGYIFDIKYLSNDSIELSGKMNTKPIYLYLVR